MHYVPIESRQIAYVGYDEESSMMAVHYCTGEVKTLATVPREAYEQLLNCANRYDYLVHLTGSPNASCGMPQE